ncbi:hypothetical protein ASZ90_016245 [hydrocarbon metagenome]|uniref:Uncharacterized protein n=1 Tax=hydrocarbon metagenome TaxID=938273 RepID=A0A0W8F0H5_9ZZZZ
MICSPVFHRQSETILVSGRMRSGLLIIAPPIFISEMDPSQSR